MPKWELRTPEEMDLAGEAAADEMMDEMGALTLEQRLVISKVADWWRRNYLKAGHKRLARILMGVK